MQRDKDPKHGTKSTPGCLMMKTIKVGRVVQRRMTANLNELKKHCKNECARIPDTDKVIRKTITSSYYCSKCFKEQLNHGMYLGCNYLVLRPANYWIVFCYILICTALQLSEGILSFQQDLYNIPSFSYGHTQDASSNWMKINLKINLANVHLPHLPVFGNNIKRNINVTILTSKAIYRKLKLSSFRATNKRLWIKQH